MKRLFIIIAAVFFTVSVFAQSPQKMSYQAVIRDSEGNLIANNTVGMRIQILQTSEFGAAVYVETHTPTTNDNGLVTLEIGNGSVVLGTFSAIDWANGVYFIKTETDVNGGTSYSISGVSQILSVPYALYSMNAASYLETDPVWAGVTSNYYTKTNLQTSGTAEVHWDNLSNIDTEVQDLADGSLSGGLVGTGIDAGNISTGILPLGRLSNITSSELSESAGITSAQINSLAATKISGITNSYIPRSNGTSLLDGLIQDNGINLGIGIAPSSDSKLAISTSSSYQGIYVENSFSSIVGSDIEKFGLRSKIFNEYDGGKAVGIKGEATSSILRPSSTNTGVYGEAQMGYHNNYGVYGKANGLTGYASSYATGVSGNAEYGVVATGVRGAASNGTTVSIGVDGIAFSTTGDNWGVRGYGNGGPGVGVGIYGTAMYSATNWAGYFDAGNVYIKNQIQAPNISSSTGTTLVLDASGWIRKLSSDRRLKENITPLNNSLDRILQLQGVKFTWKNDNDHIPDIGFIAQDVQKILPELVIEDKNDGFLSVKYQNMVVVLVEAIKDQQKQIDELKQLINNLTDK